MPDIIRLLPDSVANQIAAGEVIQRPASVVKELIENAIDSGSTNVTINIKDAGKTLIQVVDNGCGMSETDARLAFERHATSKIKKANDLFAIRSLGFRGEALASIAAIAYVELKTKLSDKEIGTYLNIVGSEVKEQKDINCPSGSNFIVKNLFFNVPARRKFLKTNSTELRHIIDEFQRIALAYPSKNLKLIHNDVEIYNLPESNLKIRIINLIGKNSVQNLLPLNSKTHILELTGFIGKPENVRKTAGEQFFFVNGRYMRNPYMYKAVMKAYEKILAPGTYPSFFIYFNLDPSLIDINIHPTKTEIKFADEKTIWQILFATVRESLGKFNVVPSIEFNQENPIEISMPSKNSAIHPPKVKIDHQYNPFDEKTYGFNKTKDSGFHDKNKMNNGESLYGEFNDTKIKSVISNIEEEKKESDQKLFSSQTIEGKFFQFKNKYILTPVKSGLMIIDQKRAHERILYERFLFSLKTKKKVSQITMFPKTLKLNPADFELLVHMIPDLNLMGFEIAVKEKYLLQIKGVPNDLNITNIEDLIDSILDEFKNTDIDTEKKIAELLAEKIAVSTAINYGQILNNTEINNLFDMLFACKTPYFSPTGKQVITIIENQELENRF
ncbi:MAG: DNA mismatch repair endonuclease MutL [Chlorobi bacterium]|nr:DNA mismatch repair endonuclease MutL [Chlorobiota bacterium]